MHRTLLKAIQSTKLTSNIIVIKNAEINNADFVDIGLSLSEELVNKTNSTKLGLIAVDELRDILEQNISENEAIGKYISLKNIGILFEKSLKIDVPAIFKSYAQNNLIIIDWEGEIENDKLYLLSKREGIEITFGANIHII